jgi:hypothetical protein
LKLKIVITLSYLFALLHNASTKTEEKSYRFLQLFTLVTYKSLSLLIVTALTYGNCYRF